MINRYFLCTLAIICLLTQSKAALSQDDKTRSAENQKNTSARSEITPPANEPKLEPKITSKPSSAIEESKEVIYESAVNFANWIDTFFGRKEELESASYDYLRLVNNLTLRKNESLKYNPRIKAKVHLPQLSETTSLLFSTSRTDSNEGFDSEENENDTIAEENDEKLSAALNYQTGSLADSKFDFRVGIDSSFDSFAFIRQSVSLIESKSLAIRNFNYLFWEDQYGFGVSTQLELNHVIDDRNLFRWKYSIRRAERSLGNEWRNKFTLVNQLSADNWMAYELRIKGDTEHEYDVESYRLSIRYRKKTSIDWLFFEIEPEIRYDRTPESIDRELIPGVTFRLEVQFEN